MSIQGSDKGYSAHYPILGILLEADVIVVRDSEESPSKVRISEACDDYYCTELNTHQLRALAAEFVAIADILDDAEEFPCGWQAN